MQKALNSIDSRERSRTIIRSGLSEEDLVVSANNISGDAEKIK